MRFTRSLGYWVPAVLWMGFIFWMSTGTFSAQNTFSIIEPILFFLIPSLSPAQADMLHGAIRKLGHVTEYFILGILLFRAFRGGSQELRLLRWTLWSFFVLLFYAATDEFHQSFVATRTASMGDVGIDALGGVLGLGVTALWRFLRQQ